MNINLLLETDILAIFIQRDRQFQQQRLPGLNCMLTALTAGPKGHNEIMEQLNLKPTLTL